ncbi:PREDICTED: GATA transcription factor 21 [Tarenaya hassleriana]|uniref:GATA transcription factor 21 n=1 Tax=Tarenaya hassleriana TaxID=28532 RepID=UPI00053C1C24|nr:PREDICTED: GATA transcription factor 21 [Tarenaya hassleriana]
MNSNFHYPIDLNEDQNHQPFFCTIGSSHHQASSSSSTSSSSLSYLPFLINSQQEHVGYNTANYHGDHDCLSQPLEAKMLTSNGGSSCDHMVPKKETRLKLTIRKKEQRTDLPLVQNQTKSNQSASSPTTTTVKWMSSKMRLMKKMIAHKRPMDRNLHDVDHKKKTSPDHSTVYDNGHGHNNGVIRVCSDCNTTKTPLWRSGPRGPKVNPHSNYQIQFTAGSNDSPAGQPPQQLALAKKKTHNKNKRTSDHFSPPPKAKKCKITAVDASPAAADDSGTQSKSSPSSSSSSSSNKFGFDDLTIILSKSSAFQKVFPQDEREAAILLMALSYGMVHG